MKVGCIDIDSFVAVGNNDEIVVDRIDGKGLRIHKTQLFVGCVGNNRHTFYQLNVLRFLIVRIFFQLHLIGELILT